MMTVGEIVVDVLFMLMMIMMMIMNNQHNKEVGKKYNKNMAHKTNLDASSTPAS